MRTGRSTRRRSGLRALALLLALAVSPAGASASEPAAGQYRLDPAHATLDFYVDHLGISRYRASFDRLDATLEIDPARPEAARLQAEVSIGSLDLPAPPEGFLKTLLSPDWMDEAAHPVARFVSDTVRPDGADRAEVSGQLTFRGVTAPVVLQVTYNGLFALAEDDPNARIGFSAEGELSRSAFGMSVGVPPPGTTLGVGDTVRLVIEAEFVRVPGP